MSENYFKRLTLTEFKRAFKEIQDVKKEVKEINSAMDQICSKAKHLRDLKIILEDLTEQLTTWIDDPLNGEESKIRIDSTGIIIDEINSTIQELESDYEEHQDKISELTSFQCGGKQEWGVFLIFLYNQIDDPFMEEYQDYIKNVERYHDDEDRLVIPPRVFLHLHHFGSCISEMDFEKIVEWSF